jgi:Tol biopolymer transport system component
VRSNRLDVVVWGVAALLLLATGVVIARGDRVGVRIEGVYPQDGESAAGSAAVRIDFAQRMKAVSVEGRFETDPHIEGTFFWRENSLFFIPSQALQRGEQYRVRLRAGAESQLGHVLQNDFIWEFEIRDPGIVFLRPSQTGAQLWGTTQLDEEPFRYSADGQVVFDYSVSGDGEYLAYSVVNDEDGISIWLVNRDGSGQQLVANCGADRCYSPDWSIDGRIAYSRAPAPITPGQPYAPPRIWLLDPQTRESVRLHADTQKIGYGPSWSPDGKRLAYFDGIQGQIVVLDMVNGNEIYLATRVGVVGTWTPDGKRMIFYDTQTVEGAASNLVFTADFETQDVLSFFEPQPTDGDYSYPVVSPDGQWVALKVRLHDGGMGDQIWVTPADGRFAFVVVDEPNYLYSNASWNPWSDAIIYYRIKLGTAERNHEVWLWEQANGELSLVFENAASPAWMP